MPRTHLDYPPGPTLYADLGEKWKHEDQLNHQRATWLLNAQAFLLTAFGVLAKLRLDVEAASGQLAEMAGNQLWMLYGLGESLIVFCAFVVTYFLRQGIAAAINAMRAIKSQLVEHKRHRRVWRSVRVDVLRGTTAAGASPSRALANTFFLVWVLCLVYEFHRNASVLLRLLFLG